MARVKKYGADNFLAEQQAYLSAKVRAGGHGQSEFEFWRQGRFRKQKLLLFANCFKNFDFYISCNIF